ncbi:MAG: hypothetical protein JSS21_02235 [Proteobacteria bacterium]|nr:hypothetical protein [Pseudomonadota bacterium]
MDTAIASQLLDSIVAAEHSLVLMRCDDAPSLLDLMHRHAIRTGLALYAWDEQAGLHSLRDAQVPVAGVQRFGEALRYVIQSAHFGVYFFAGHPPVFDATLIPLLRQAARLGGEHARRVVLLDPATELPAGVEAAELNRGVTAASRPRLRDGQWMRA